VGRVTTGRREIVITSGEGNAMLDALFCLTDPGDEVVLTDPTYAGMLNRVRLVGAVPRLVPLYVSDGEWRLDLEALPAAVTERTRVVFVNNASFPSGWVATDEEWEAIGSICRERDLGSSTGRGTKASSSIAGRSGIPPHSRACVIEPSPSARHPWSSG
jgi:aspartate/methionine/tyrosine aminotransferase